MKPKMRHEGINALKYDELRVDYGRTADGWVETGIYVRAKLDGKFGSYDISQLDAESLLIWLRSRGGENVWAENTVCILLGHGQIWAKDD